MNRAFLLILAPAMLVALLYWGMGFRPSPRVGAGMLLFFGVALWVARRKGRPGASR